MNASQIVSVLLLLVGIATALVGGWRVYHNTEVRWQHFTTTPRTAADDDRGVCRTWRSTLHW